MPLRRTMRSPRPRLERKARRARPRPARPSASRWRPEAFQKKYGTNHNLRNAFGKCVSASSKDGDDEKDEDDDEDGKSSGAVKPCKAERTSTGADAFAKKYGTNHNLHNAFGKCVSSKAKGKAKDKDDD